MTPEEKSQELIEDLITPIYEEYGGAKNVAERIAKECALLTLEYILEAFENSTVLVDGDYPYSFNPNADKTDYYNAIKEHLLKA